MISRIRYGHSFGVRATALYNRLLGIGFLQTISVDRTPCLAPIARDAILLAWKLHGANSRASFEHHPSTRHGTNVVPTDWKIYDHSITNEHLHLTNMWSIQSFLFLFFLWFPFWWSSFGELRLEFVVERIRKEFICESAVELRLFPWICDQTWELPLSGLGVPSIVTIVRISTTNEDKCLCIMYVKETRSTNAYYTVIQWIQA